ncbi:MAG: DUF354 domain-containing protein [Candidatus Brocadiia bacterium]
MKVLIDFQHPAHVHFFRNVIERLRGQGHAVKLTGRDKDILVMLAEEYDLQVEIFGRAKPGLFNLGGELLYRWWKLWKIVRRWKPDRMLAGAGTCVSLIGFLTGTPTHVFYDTEHATLSNMLAYPFATCIHIPECYNKPIRWRYRCYPGYHTLAYLHPNYFTPDPSVLNDLNVGKDEQYVLLRFVSWGAAHDAGYEGLRDSQKRRAIEELRKEARVFLSIEGEVPPDFKPLLLPTALSQIHDVIAFSSLVFGESGTMSSEAAVLGVPAVYVNPLQMGYLHEQEDSYGLVYNFRPPQFDDALYAAKEALRCVGSRTYTDRRENLLSEKIDVTAMIEKVATGKTLADKMSSC